MTYFTYHNALQKWGSQYSLRIICKGKNSRTKSSRIFHAPNIENTQVTLIPLAYHMSKNGSHQGFFKYIFTYNKVNTLRLHSLIYIVLLYVFNCEIIVIISIINISFIFSNFLMCLWNTFLFSFPETHPTSP